MPHAHVVVVNPFRCNLTQISDMATKPLVNKVKTSTKLSTLDMEQWLKGVNMCLFDLKPLLFKELIVKEDHFNDQLASLDYSKYNGAIVAIHCSVESIIPSWAWLKPIPFLNASGARFVHVGTTADAKHGYLSNEIHNYDWTTFQDKNVILKGCSNEAISDDLYGLVLQKLSLVASKVMIGEACSNVPLFKR